MEKAEQFLRGSNMTVAEVANLVGYSHLGHFAAAFKKKYGITPKEILLGKKSVSGL
jgi:AraC-like DNA-binding protein